MRDEKGFYKGLLDEAGIEKDWVEWAEQDMEKDICHGNDYEMHNNWLKHIENESKIEISNPKEVLDEAIPSTDELITVAVVTFADMWIGRSDADLADIVMSYYRSACHLYDT
ncbi:hypothetical protein NW762_011129 [Fusarium torreyae]|uniref:Uncharacterized protein n=1 Tax=Fusarium torreyae TaxID=1237075 RepID=A0A9W8RTJ3_9HYPO|nr:hypothetical protein NW762_011129 [Fusarium torreyae]